MTDSAIWLTCRECGHTTRVLALLASRVLARRMHCPECQSTCEPCVNATPAGSGISLSPEQSAALREMDDKDVRVWMERRANHSAARHASLHWLGVVPSRLTSRFTRARTHADGRSLASGDLHPMHADTFADAGTIGKPGTAAIRP